MNGLANTTWHRANYNISFNRYHVWLEQDEQIFDLSDSKEVEQLIMDLNYWVNQIRITDYNG